MLKKKTISSQVLKKVITFTVVLLFVICVVVSAFVCSRIYNRETESQQNAIDKYVWSVDTSIKNAIERSAGITTWPTITEGLRRTEMTAYEKYVLSENIRSFMDNISNNDDVSYKIYIANQFLYRDKYVKSFNELSNYRSVIAGLKNGGTYLDPKIYTKLGRQYIKLFIDAYWGDDSFVEADIMMPSADNYRVELKPLDDNVGINDISEKISDTYVAVLKTDTSSLYRQMAYSILVVFGVCILILLLIYVIMRNTIARTVKELTDVLRDLDANIDQTYEVAPAKDTEAEEVRQIKLIVNRLLEQVKQITAEKAKSDLEKRELNVYMLRKQLDPHTLYNSLAVIKLRAFKNNDEQTIKIIDDLVSYYRAVLNKGSYYSTIAEEASLLEKFIIVSGTAREMKYDYIYNIEQGLEGVRIPQMLFHVFVENAIVHSFTNDTYEPKIEFDVASDGEFIVATVKNNGISMTQDRLDGLNNDIGTAGYGIKNAYKRIQIYFGEDSTINYAQAVPSGTIVTVRFRRK